MFSCSVACAILPDQGSNPSLLRRQADSSSLSHQGRPPCLLMDLKIPQRSWPVRVKMAAQAGKERGNSWRQSHCGIYGVPALE